jgi:hypothetical protein
MIKKLSEDSYCDETIELKLEEFELHRNTIFDRGASIPQKTICT